MVIKMNWQGMRAPGPDKWENRSQAGGGRKADSSCPAGGHSCIMPTCIPAWLGENTRPAPPTCMYAAGGQCCPWTYSWLHLDYRLALREVGAGLAGGLCCCSWVGS